MRSKRRRLCVFCHRWATTKRGEHIFDDWLSRIDGKSITSPFTFTQTGVDGRLIRTFRKRSMDTTADVVCDSCNHGWMSDLSKHVKETADGFIHHGRSATLLPLGIATLGAYVFMKSAVVDNMHNASFIPRSISLQFARTLEPPEGTQLWLAWCRTGRVMSAHAWANAMTITNGTLAGYRIYVFTYQLGHLAFQMTFPLWMKGPRNRPPHPVITQHTSWDIASLPIWPNVATAEWPPKKYFDREMLAVFKERFNNMVGPMSAS